MKRAAAFFAGMLLMFVFFQFRTKGPLESDAAGNVRYLGPKIPAQCAEIGAWQTKECAKYFPETEGFVPSTIINQSDRVK